MGVGIARENGPATIAADVILQPVWSHTWALAEDPGTRDDGSVIPAGARTVNNRFEYLNALLRIGVERAMAPVTFAAGLDLYSVNYQLRQHDLVTRTRRTQREEWIEWSPALGATVQFPEFALRYTGRLRTGTGMPGIAPPFQTEGRSGSDLAGGSVDFLPAPGAPLTLADALVMTHQVVLTMPLGNQR